MTAIEIVAQLEKLGNPQTKKTWINHGAQEPCLGVKIGDMKTLQKRLKLKMDYQLALDLYDTGIADAMYFAGLIADDARMTRKDLQRWVKAANSPWVTEYTVPWVASGSPHGRELALEWMDAKRPEIAAAGWQTYSSIVATHPDAALDLDELQALLARVEKSIHKQSTRIKVVMNHFVIAVGCYVKPLHARAVATAKAIGKVDVELVGDCTIPFAPQRIQQFKARSPIGKKRKSAKC